MLCDKFNTCLEYIMLGPETAEKIVFPILVWCCKAFRFMQLSCIPCLASCIVNFSNAKQVSTFARFKIMQVL
jgi:hypothetical protein